MLSRGEAHSVMTQTHVNCTHSEPEDSTGAERLRLSEKKSFHLMFYKGVGAGSTQSGGESLRIAARIYRMIHYERCTDLC